MHTNGSDTLAKQNLMSNVYLTMCHDHFLTRGFPVAVKWNTKVANDELPESHGAGARGQTRPRAKENDNGLR